MNENNGKNAESEKGENRGLLDLSVELSTRDVMAGNEFVVFVLVKNPYTLPIWIRRVHVSLPRELRNVAFERMQMAVQQNTSQIAELKKAEEQNRRELAERITEVEKTIGILNSKLSKSNLDKEDADQIKHLALENLERLRFQVNTGTSTSAVTIGTGSKVDKVRVQAGITAVTIGSMNGGYAEVQEVEIIDPKFMIEQQAVTRKVELESSLPEGVALQPGNTAVYSVSLDVRSALFFRTSRYRLQFNVNYSFSSENQRSESSDVAEDILFTNTVNYELSIRASVYSVILGSAAGGIVGGIARILQVTQQADALLLTQGNILAISVSVILGIMAVIFMARKSDSQSFLSVEDFWGGLLVGFLVGYTGTSFFEDLTGLQRPTA